MGTTMAFMTIRKTFMHRRIMGFTMTGAAFLYHLMPLLVTVHTLQFAVLTCIKLLKTVLFLVAAAAQCGGYIFFQSGWKRGMGLMALKAVAILHGIGMPLMTIQTAEMLAMGRMALITLQLGMGGRNTFHLLARFGMTAQTDRTQIFY